MRTRRIVAIFVVLAAAALAWALWLHAPTAERTSAIDERAVPAQNATKRDPVQRSGTPGRTDVPSSSSNRDPIDAAARARFNERAREFFAQAPALSPEEARQRAAPLAQELSRIEQAGGMSAGETFLLRAGLIRATEPDEQRQAVQLRALKERYEIDRRQRSGQSATQADPMFELYKVRESEIVAEVMSLQTIPDGLSREEYLRRRLQKAREQLLGGAM
jgi:hypothetical protein